MKANDLAAPKPVQAGPQPEPVQAQSAAPKEPVRRLHLAPVQARQKKVKSKPVQAAQTQPVDRAERSPLEDLDDLSRWRQKPGEPPMPYKFTCVPHLLLGVRTVQGFGFSFDLRSWLAIQCVTFSSVISCSSEWSRNLSSTTRRSSSGLTGFTK